MVASRRRGVVIYDFKAIFSNETRAACQAKLKLTRQAYSGTGPELLQSPLVDA